MNQQQAQAILQCIHFALQHAGSNALNAALIAKQYVAVELSEGGQEMPELEEKEEE